MTIYTDPFGGGAPQPSDISYAAIVLVDATTQLAWPSVAQQGEIYIARLVDFTTVPAASVVRLPPGDQVSTGQDALLTNRGANSLTLQTSTGVVVATIDPGDSVYVYLTDNSTASGSWSSTLFGVGVSAVSAGALAGSGLQANGSELELDLEVVTASVGFTVTSVYRTQTIVWTGGTDTLTLAAVSSVDNGFFFSVRNQGTGVLTLAASGADLVDGSATISLQPEESCTVQAGAAANYYTVGRGRNQSFGFTLLIKAITGGTVNLTATEASNVVQRYTGVLVSNCEVVFPSVVQVYYVSNQTSGAFSVTFKTGGVGSTVVVPQGQNAILFCDGTNVINTSTTVSGLTSLILNPGAVTAPAISFIADTSTGVYQAVSGSVSVAGVGTEVARFTGVALGVNYLQFTNAIAAAHPTISAQGPGANINLQLAAKGTGVVSAQGTLTATTQILIPAGTVAAPGMGVSGDPDTGWFSGGANVLRGATGGLTIFSLNSTPGVHIGDTAVDAAAPSVGTYNRPRLNAVGTTQYGFNENTMFSTSVNSAHGAYVNSRFASGAYTTTNYFGLRVADATLGGGGHAITNAIGLYVDDLVAGSTSNRGLRLTLSSGTGKHNLYSDGTADNYIRGNLGIGSGKTAPAVALDIAGEAAVTSSSGATMFSLESTNAGANGVMVKSFANSASPANGDDLFNLSIEGNDSAGGSLPYATLLVEAGSVGVGATQTSLTLATRQAGSLVAILQVSSGTIAFPSVGTTASAANAFLDVGAAPQNRLLRSTSSIRYKTDVQPLGPATDDLLSRLRPITYRSLSENDDPDRRWYGLIAEEVADVEPLLVHYTKGADGQLIPDGVQYDRLVVLLIDKIAKLEAELNRLAVR